MLLKSLTTSAYCIERTHMKWDDLDFWRSPEWQTIQDRLDDFDLQGPKYNPARENLFAALDCVPLEQVKVLLLGQDPYPNSKHATGVAFSVPKSITDYPPTLLNIFKEYCEDLHYDWPPSGNLLKWCAQGVLLWNAVPTCKVNEPCSHKWMEWGVLTKEIVTELSKRSIVFVALGNVAKAYMTGVDGENLNRIIRSSHPSPLGAKYGFLGSRLFSTINVRLRELGKSPIDWRL